jgi:hypothetical protein
MSEAARAHIRDTIVAATPATGIPKSARFLDVDRQRTQTTGRQLLELYGGKTRLFELADGNLSKLLLGGVDPRAWNERINVRVRYDAPNQHNVSDLMRIMRGDQIAIVRALYQSAWSSVAGLAVLNAEPRELVSRFEDPEDGLGGYIAEVEVFISYDVT